MNEFMKDVHLLDFVSITLGLYLELCVESDLGLCLKG